MTDKLKEYYAGDLEACETVYLYEKADELLAEKDKEISELKTLLGEYITAMIDYEMAVDTPPPHEHRNMMMRARLVLDNYNRQ